MTGDGTETGIYSDEHHLERLGLGYEVRYHNRTSSNEFSDVKLNLQSSSMPNFVENILKTSPRSQSDIHTTSNDTTQVHNANSIYE